MISHAFWVAPKTVKQLTQSVSTDTMHETTLPPRRNIHRHVLQFPHLQRYCAERRQLMTKESQSAADADWYAPDFDHCLAWLIATLFIKFK